MITLIDNALTLGENCCLVSCQFDIQQLESTPTPEIEAQWQIDLPDSLQTAVNKRKAEFIAGRYCAKKAMKQLQQHLSSLHHQAIGIGANRQPLWPAGTIGSITHSQGFAAAAVADNKLVSGLGIDSEQFIDQKTADNVAPQILTAEENYSDNRQLVESAPLYLTLVFSAKESIFKCLYPRVGRYFDFKDAAIRLSSSQPGHFEFVLLKSLTEELGQGFAGQGVYRFQEGFVHTAIVL